MNYSRALALMLVPAFLWSGLALAQTKNVTQAAKQQAMTNQAEPKAFSCPDPSTLGDVSLHVAIDTKGNVSEAKALSGAKNLIPAAEACARTWKYENPPSTLVTRTVVLRYESRDCPATESQHGELQYSWGLRNRSNLVLAYVKGEPPPPPPYPDEDRKAGLSGRMALSVSLKADGTVKELHVLQSLSPRLDKAVMDELRPLQFQPFDGISEMQLQDLLFQIDYHATCTVAKIVNNAAE